MRRFYACFTAILSILLLLSACATPVPRNDFAYAEEGFSVAVSGTYLPANDPDGPPRPFAATVTAGTPLSASDLTARDLTVTFTEPATLRGVTVTARVTPAPEGAMERSVVFSYPSEYGAVEFTAKGSELDGLLRFAEALLPIGDVAEVSPVAEDGTHTVTRRVSDGSREAVFTFAEGVALPTRVTVTDGRGRLELAVRGEGETGD